MTDIGLTVAELEDVERTWGLVTKNLRDNGVAIFMAIFTNYPQYLKLFKRFDGVKMEELEKHPSMKAHATTFMRGMSALIDNLRDKDTLVCLVKDIAQRHYPRKIRTEEYSNVFGVLLPFLQTALGKELTNDAANGWKKILDVMTSIIRDEEKALDAKK